MWSYRHSRFTVHQLTALRDNYIYLIEADNSDTLIAVDPAEAKGVQQFCKEVGKPLTHILNTHHHWDHTDGNMELKQQFGCKIVGAASDADRIPGIDITTSEHSPPELPGLEVGVLELPGHTSGHIGYLIDDAPHTALFCGDVLFGGGCGRIFEGTPEEMWQSLTKIAALPREAKVYCAHEYTLPNLRFARTIDVDNKRLVKRIRKDSQSRMEKRPTIPSTLLLELETNPFLRPLDRDFCQHYAAQEGVAEDAEAVFRDIRRRKDSY